MRQYLQLCERILNEGVFKGDRTGTGTMSVFGHQMRFKLEDGFPLMTTKDMSEQRFAGIIEELLWFISGDTNMKTLLDKGVNIWNRDAYRGYLNRTRSHTPLTYKEFIRDMRELPKDSLFVQQHGDLGPVYGKQWRNWTAQGALGEYTVDQLAEVIDLIKMDPDSRRLIVSAWNPGEIPLMTLPPCHMMYQYYVAEGRLSLHMYQRSADVFLGLPYNIASYAAKLMMVAQQTDLLIGELIITIGDAHIYLNHMDQVKEQITREPYKLPTLSLRRAKDIDSYTIEDFKLFGYKHHPELKGDVSVGN